MSLIDRIPDGLVVPCPTPGGQLTLLAARSSQGSWTARVERASCGDNSELAVCRHHQGMEESQFLIGTPSRH